MVSSLLISNKAGNLSFRGVWPHQASPKKLVHLPLPTTVFLPHKYRYLTWNKSDQNAESFALSDFINTSTIKILLPSELLQGSITSFYLPPPLRHQAQVEFGQILKPQAAFTFGYANQLAFERVIDVLTAEAQAIRNGLRFAEQIGCNRIYMETDAPKIVQAITDPKQHNIAGRSSERGSILAGFDSGGWCNSKINRGQWQPEFF
jgi:hypothetical protein